MVWGPVCERLVLEGWHASAGWQPHPAGVFFENETGPGHRCVPMRPGASGSPARSPPAPPPPCHLGSVSFCVQNRLRETSGHGKRLIDVIDLLTKEQSHDHPNQA